MLNKYRPPSRLKALTSGLLTWEMPAGQNKIYITFDDGPDARVTPSVMGLLDRYQAKATFFLLGRNVEKYPFFPEHLRSRGHSIGNHSFSHPDGWKCSSRLYLEDVQKCSQWMDSKLFRPPYGRITIPQARQLKKQGFNLFMWSVLSNDFDRFSNPAQCLAKTIRYTTDGAIVVFHDSLKAEKKMLFMLEGFLEHFSREGFSFEALPVE